MINLQPNTRFYRITGREEIEQVMDDFWKQRDNCDPPFLVAIFTRQYYPGGLVIEGPTPMAKATLLDGPEPVVRYSLTNKDSNNTLLTWSVDLDKIEYVETLYPRHLKSHGKQLAKATTRNSRRHDHGTN